MTAPAICFSLHRTVVRHSAARRFAAWLAVLALVIQTLAMLAPMPAAAGDAPWPADSLCRGSDDGRATLPDGRTGAPLLHDCQSCVPHLAAKIFAPPGELLLAPDWTGAGAVLPSADRPTLARHGSSTAHPRAPPRV